MMSVTVTCSLQNRNGFALPDKGNKRESRGNVWHTILLARCSVLHLLRRLMGGIAPPDWAGQFRAAGKQGDICKRQRADSTLFSVSRDGCMPFGSNDYYRQEDLPCHTPY